MSTALSIFGVIFAGAMIWLTVRIVNRRERWAKWTAVALAVMAVCYPLSVGPACRVLTVAKNPGWAVEAYHVFYAPIWWVYCNGPQPIRSAIDWYCRAWT